jgi:hypothetical protein
VKRRSGVCGRRCSVTLLVVLLAVVAGIQAGCTSSAPSRPGPPSAVSSAASASDVQRASARHTLDTAQLDVDSLNVYVQVLQETSADSTESIAATRAIAQILGPLPRMMQGEVASLRKRIKAYKSATYPTTFSNVSDHGDSWRLVVAQAPGATGKHAVAAITSLLAATKCVDKSFASKYAADALKALSPVDKLLQDASREIAAIRIGH